MAKFIHTRRWVIAGAVLVAILIVAGVLLVQRSRSYSAADIAKAKANVQAINNQFAALGQLQDSNDPSVELRNDKTQQAVYQKVAAQFDQLRRSAVLHNQTTHGSFTALDTAWQAKYSYTTEYVNYLEILDAFDSNAPSGQYVAGTDTAAALTAYNQAVHSSDTALQALQTFHPAQAHIRTLAGTLKTYLTTYKTVNQKAADSVRQNKDLFNPAVSATGTELLLAISADQNMALSAPGNTYTAASKTDYAAANADLNGLSIKPQIDNFSATLAKLQPNA